MSALLSVFKFYVTAGNCYLLIWKLVWSNTECQLFSIRIRLLTFLGDMRKIPITGKGLRCGLLSLWHAPGPSNLMSSPFFP